MSLNDFSPVELADRVRGERHEIGRDPKEEYVASGIEKEHFEQAVEIISHS